MPPAFFMVITIMATKSVESRLNLKALLKPTT